MRLKHIIICLSYIFIVIASNIPSNSNYINKNEKNELNESSQNNTYNENDLLQSQEIASQETKRNKEQNAKNENISTLLKDINKKEEGVFNFNYNNYLNKNKNNNSNSNNNNNYKINNNSYYNINNKQNNNYNNKINTSNSSNKLLNISKIPTITEIKTMTITSCVSQPTNIEKMSYIDTDLFTILKSSTCINLLNRYFKPNISIYFENDVTLITSSQGFIINRKGIPDCSKNVSSNISNNKIKLMTYDPRYGLCIGKECYRVERVIDFSCKFENNKNKNDFPTEKTIWYSLYNSKSITTFYDGKSMTCIGNQCPLSYECTLRNPDDLIDISFNYFNGKLSIKNSQNEVETYTNNSETNAILNILSKLNISNKNNYDINACDFSNYITCKDKRIVALDLSKFIIKKEIWDLIIKIESLEELTLRDCSLTSNLLENIGNLINLKKLDISKNLITTGLKYITSLSHIEYINISFNNIKDDISLLQSAKSTLITFIASNTLIKGNINSLTGLLKIEKINLYKTKVSGEIANPNSNIKSMSTFNTSVLPYTLTYLDISMTSVSGDVNNIFSLPCNLEYINISNTLINGSIQSNLYKVQSLKSINFSNTIITGNLSENIKNLRNLKEINLSKTDIMNINLEYFKTLTNLEIINISQTKASGIIPSEIVNLKNLILFDIHNTKIEGFVPNNFFNLLNLNIVDLSNTYLCGTYNEDVCGVNSKMDGSVRVIPSCKVNANMCVNCSFCPTICHPLIFKYKFIDWGIYEEITFEKDIYNPTRVLCKGSSVACPVTYYYCVNAYNSDNTVNKIYFDKKKGHITMTNYVNFISNENLLEPVDDTLYTELKSLNTNSTEEKETYNLAIQNSFDSLLSSEDTNKFYSDFISVNNATTDNNKNTTSSNSGTSSNQPINFNSTEEMEKYYKNYYDNYYKDYYKKDSDNNLLKLITFACLICWAVGFLLFIVWILIKHSDSERYCRKCYDFIILIPAALLAFPFSIVCMLVYYCVTYSSPCLPKYDIDLIIELGQNSESFKNFVKSKTEKEKSPNKTVANNTDTNNSQNNQDNNNSSTSSSTSSSDSNSDK